MKNINASTQVSDQDYLPDDESSGDDDYGEMTAAQDKELKSGKFESSSRNLDNEFVFDKEWAFRRKCSLQSLLSARLMTSSYQTKKLELPRHLTCHRRSEWCAKESPMSCNGAEKCGEHRKQNSYQLVMFQKARERYLEV
ncbi:hypothetical protein ACROYT_G003356 [Oculina patagonica]